MSDDTSVTITNNEAQGRYEARVDGELAGILEYQLGEGIVLFPHTEVHPQFGGRGSARSSRPGRCVRRRTRACR